MNTRPKTEGIYEEVSKRRFEQETEEYEERLPEAYHFVISEKRLPRCDRLRPPTEWNCHAKRFSGLACVTIHGCAQGNGWRMISPGSRKNEKEARPCGPGMRRERGLRQRNPNRRGVPLPPAPCPNVNSITDAGNSSAPWRVSNYGASGKNTRAPSRWKDSTSTSRIGSSSCSSDLPAAARRPRSVALPGSKMWTGAKSTLGTGS